MAQVLATNSSAGAYTFASQPRALQQRKKYKDSLSMDQSAAAANGVILGQYGNIMYDRRVIRGNTYALNTLPATAQPDPIEVQRQQEERKRALARRRAKEQARRHTPEPVEGRKHVPIQTELYLEELSDRVEEADVDVQTDAFLDRPPSPLFVPAKTGMDVETQIYEGDLFYFDIEVRPILEVLVGKTIEQSLIEVMEEEELARLRKQQREFEEVRNAEKIEQQRLEEQERRLREEKNRRMKQAAEVQRMEQETAEKLAAKAFAKSYLNDLVPSVFNNLRENGYFYDPVNRDVEIGFMPFIMSQTLGEIDQHMLGRLVLDTLLREVVTRRDLDYETLAKRMRVEAAAAVSQSVSSQSEQQPQQQADNNNNGLGADSVPADGNISAAAGLAGNAQDEQDEQEEQEDEAVAPTQRTSNGRIDEDQQEQDE